MRKIARKKSQIATILTLIMALIFLFIVITINLGKVSHRKTVIDNACDSAALFMASSLSSIINALRVEFDIYGTDYELCEPDWTAIIGIILIIGGIIGAIFSGGATLIAAIATVCAISSVVAGTLIIASSVLFAAFTEPGLMKEMQIKFQNMTAEQKIFEGGIQAALFSTTDDAKWVNDRFDADRDTRKFPAVNDKIPRFSHWYLQRLNSLPRLGTSIEAFYDYLFDETNGVIDVTVDAKQDATAAYLLANGIRIRPWLDGSFKWFIHNRLWPNGYGFTNPQEFEYEDEAREDDYLDGLIIMIQDFELYLKDIYNSSRDDLIATFETWIKNFYDSSVDYDWYDKLGEWENMLTGMINELNSLDTQASNCINQCEEQAYDCCDAEDPCTMGCCGAVVDCCRNCTDADCPPTYQCNTPTGGLQPCCSSGCNLRRGNTCNTQIPYYRTRLEDLLATVQGIRGAIDDLVDAADDAKNDPWATQAIYVWKDIVLNESGTEVSEESPAHMVYIEVDLSNFEFPYPNQVHEVRWWLFIPVPSYCKRVENARGEFGFTVARYDEDLAKRGPLANFWRFKFRQNPGLAESGSVNTLRRVADDFARLLDSGDNCTLDALIRPGSADFRALRSLALNQGVIASVTANYGYGYTYPSDQLPGQANLRNQDIYIERIR